MTLAVDVGIRRSPFHLNARFAVDEPGVTALFGPSGAGKSTLVQAIAGLIRPERGRIVIDQEVVFDAAERIAVPAWRRRAGYVFQDGRLFPHLTVEGNLRFGARRHRGAGAEPAFRAMVELLGLDGLLARRPRSLSGGEKQRVALGRALLANPRILLLDEPLSALDEGRKGEILPFLARIRDDTQVPIVYVTHSLDELTRLADTLVILDRGEVVATAPVAEALADLELLPYTGAYDAGAIVTAEIDSHDRADQLSLLAFDGGRLWVPLLDQAPGAPVRARVRARDVVVALSEPADSSANNLVPATVSGWREGAGAHVDLQLRAGSATLLARITRRSFRRLGLASGTPVVAVIKAVSVESGGTRATAEPV
ncbi:MAG: molybdenum ABC transporter ATP-binding protein [Pseudomonadota bacterium]